MPNANISNIITALASFAKARWHHATLTDRHKIEKHHAKKLEKLKRHSSAFPYYQPYVDKPFEQWPVIDKAEMVQHLHLMNLGQIKSDEIRTALNQNREAERGFVIGQSTGTSGNRGYYIISDRERFVWLGKMIAKTLPDILYRSHRVALALPGLSSLYQSASQGGRVRLGFFDLAEGVDAWEEQLVAFSPDTIVAPPKVLREFAERGTLTADRIFSGAEVLDALDKEIIERVTGRIARQIYMATEGLFGVSCEHGTLHLAEDVVYFEWEAVSSAPSLKTPIVTDFTRRSQAMIRYRMNDLLELETEPCPCGSAFQAVRRIVGRQDDVFHLHAKNGEVKIVTPDVIRNAIVDSDRRITDYRATQIGGCDIEIRLEAHLVDALADGVKSKILERLLPFDVHPNIEVKSGMDVPFDKKLRRIQNAYSQRSSSIERSP